MIKEFDIRKRTFNYSLEVLRFTKSVKKDLEISVIIKQLIRCSTSIGANVYEAKGGSSIKDFANNYLIALKSCNETIYWLKLLKEYTPDLALQLKPLIEEADELSKILAKIVINSKSNSA